MILVFVTMLLHVDWMFLPSRLTSLLVIAVCFHLWMFKSCVCVSPCCVTNMPPKNQPRMDVDVSPSESESDSDEGGPFYAMHFGANGETLMREGAGYPSPQAMMIAQFLQGFVQKRIDEERGPGTGLASTTSPCATTLGSIDGGGALMIGNSDFTSNPGTATSLVGDSTNDAQDEDALSTQQDARQQAADGEKKRRSKKAGKKKKKTAKK